MWANFKQFSSRTTEILKTKFWAQLLEALVTLWSIFFEDYFFFNVAFLTLWVLNRIQFSKAADD